jgi:hypothetical protein
MAEAVEVTQLTLLQGNGDTFLSRIDAAMDGYGTPDQHRYTELSYGQDVLWQGEVLIYGDRQRTFLQQAKAGGGDALLLDAPANADLASILALQADNGNEPISSPHPTIRFVRARQTGNGVWSFDVTLEYPDTGWDDYADGWHVESPEGDILGTRILLHPHVGEQPFTRSLSGVAIPPELSEVIVRSHDLVSGYSRDVVTVPVGEAGSGDGYEVVR